jgi:hypothetical protein
MQMKPINAIVTALALTFLIPVAGVDAQGDTLTNSPAVTAPPESFFAKVRQGRKTARKFYKKCIYACGLPIAASAEVDDRAMVRAQDIVSHMLAGRPDVLKAMVDSGMYLVIIGKDQGYTDLPENRNLPDKAYLNERVRGTGGRPTSFGEENLLSLPLDRYDDESIAVHEFCHTIDGTLRKIDPTWESRMKATYRHAVEKGLYKDTYWGSCAGEYWAELAQTYFDSNRVNNYNHGPIGRREQLKIYDPEGYELVRSTFNLSADQDWRYRWLQQLPNVETPPAKFNIDPYYTKFTWAREFTVVGRETSDEALLKANDTIRKMFAYRHDILKALINDNAKLVVLGPNEGLSDLPEYKNLQGKRPDHMARMLDYTPELKLMVVGQENVLADLDNDRYATGCQVVRVFAKALYRVTAKRPVDPNWDDRRLRVQQYELRVQRMDVRFDERLEATYKDAMKKGLWKGTAAVHDRVDYWAEGVAAYFDAVGQGTPPNDADRPITTREALQQYDPGLYSLVDDTMGYRGKVDWRHRSTNAR